jgi:hypothetical protein
VAKSTTKSPRLVQESAVAAQPRRRPSRLEKSIRLAGAELFGPWAIGAERFQRFDSPFASHFRDQRRAKKSWDSDAAKTIDAAAPCRLAPHFTLAISHAFRG